MSTTFTNLTAAIVAMLIAIGTIVPVVTVPPAGNAITAVMPELV